MLFFLNEQFHNLIIALQFIPRGMLSAAHILAMNAKNLLDVVDHVRIKHPHVNVLFSANGWTESRLA